MQKPGNPPSRMLDLTVSSFTDPCSEENQTNSTMEEALESILQACELSRKLQTDLPNLAKHRNLLIDSCSEIVKSLNLAMNQLSNSHPSLSNLERGYPWAIQSPKGKREVVELMEISPESHDIEVFRSPATESAKKRKGGRESSILRVCAPRIEGAMDTLPEDSFTWRKYGQKEILNSKFPKSYYRCAHRTTGCEAKKYVQRLDNDPQIIEVTYLGRHICQASRPEFQAEMRAKFEGTIHNSEKVEEIPTASVAKSSETLMTTGFKSGKMETREGSESPILDYTDVMFTGPSGGINMDSIFSCSPKHED
ncbi:WRKY transcription factor 55 isoform X1 [Amborella trichopoda]|nr:WRKY transcription factor 55 isoform X1 [Amborella trichopoda]|eukprot:XP_006842506.3 WRKY transcription factor 55 isoform X1 [Amborella trichopoda]